MKVVEIFRSIDGEGKRTGLPAVFIRLYGCNLRCTYCDTRYGCEGEGYTIRSVEQIVSSVKALGVKNVTITGGEPLIHPDINCLVAKLLEEGYWVNIETNGTVDVENFRYDISAFSKVNIKKLFFTVDYKCPWSGMSDRMVLDTYKRLWSVDVVKFVVSNEEDMDAALAVLRKTNPMAEVYFSPVFGKIRASEIVDYILDHELYDVKVQVQLHKVIWSPDMRGV